MGPIIANADRELSSFFFFFFFFFFHSFSSFHLFPLMSYDLRLVTPHWILEHLLDEVACGGERPIFFFCVFFFHFFSYVMDNYNRTNLKKKPSYGFINLS
jgi:hypothetical protein